MERPHPPVKNEPIVSGLARSAGDSDDLEPAMAVSQARPQLVQLLSGMDVGDCMRRYRPNENIFVQGDPANAVFYIESGEVKLGVVSRNGKQAIVDILGERSFFGEGCLAGEPVRVVTAIAVEPSNIIRMEKRVLLSLFHRSPWLAEEFIGQLASRNLRMQADLADHIFNSSEKRLARLLLNLSKPGKRESGVIPHVTQEMLAEMVGTTRSRVSFFLNRFRECGYISYNRNALQVHRSLVTVLLRGGGSRSRRNRNPVS